MKRLAFLTLLPLALAGCGQEEELPEGQVSGEQVAEKLEDAADQSGPAARDVLDRAAEAAEERESLEPVDEPGSYAQRAMQEAGEAQVKAGTQAAE